MANCSSSCGPALLVHRRAPHLHDGEVGAAARREPVHAELAPEQLALVVVEHWFATIAAPIVRGRGHAGAHDRARRTYGRAPMASAGLWATQNIESPNGIVAPRRDSSRSILASR